jgi:CubicO group peptidase (beta-lactamase class C family)
MDNLAEGVPLTVDTRFEIGSVSKHVTGVAILVLVADGLVDLDASVATYLPEAGPWVESMTVEQLLHHTSGLADYIGIFLAMGENMPDPVDTDEVLGVLLSVPATESPVPWEYSTSNYVVLAKIIEVVSGKSFSDFVEERLFAPQGSSLVVDTDAAYPVVATRYAERMADAPALENGWQAYGDSSVVATPSALARWFDVLRTGLDGYPTLGDDMIANPALIDVESGNTYGAGVTITPDGRIWHSGYKPGQISYLSMSPDRSMTLAISCNADELEPQVTILESEFERIWFGTG